MPPNNKMPPTHTFPPVQDTLAAPIFQPGTGIDQATLDSITAYTVNMQASVASYRNAMQAVFFEHSEQCNAMIAMQQKYITERESLHHRQMQELIDTFHCRYEALEAQLTAEQMQNFREYMKTMQGDLDLWPSDAAEISKHSIEDFLNGPTTEEIPCFEFSTPVEECMQ